MATDCELIGAMAVGQEAVIADALETSGQGVLQEEADELLGRHPHHLVEGVAVVGPSEGDLAVLEGQQSLVADGDAVRVAAEILQYVSGSPEGRLGVNHPLFVFEGSQEPGKGAGIAQRFEVAEELQEAIRVRLRQRLQ